MEELKAKLRAVVDIAQQDPGMDPEDADLIRSAYQQAIVLDPEDEHTSERVNLLVRGVADVVDGSKALGHGVEIRRRLAAIVPGLSVGVAAI